jgi:acyl carrier protein
MTNESKFIEAFASGLQIDRSLIVDDLKYNSIAQWDSIAHMALVAALEEAFGVMLDTNDIIDMSSVQKAREILAKYDVQFA